MDEWMNGYDMIYCYSVAGAVDDAMCATYHSHPFSAMKSAINSFDSSQCCSFATAFFRAIIEALPNPHTMPCVEAPGGSIFD